MGYVPGRVGLDLRLVTAIQVPPPGQTRTTNATMYTFYSKAFCSGCDPGMELGMDTCAIVSSYNDTTNALVVRSSHAVYGTYHVLGISLYRRWDALASIVLRIVCVLMATSAFAASNKTVRWTDPQSLTMWVARVKHMLAPPYYRHATHAFGFVYFTFNSDVIVALYAIVVLMDENVEMVYARVINRWAKPAGFSAWSNLRLWACATAAPSRRWMAQLALCLMGLLDGCVHVVRTDYMEYCNSINVVLSSATDDLDAIFAHSWYVRGLPSLLALMLLNLVLVLAMSRTWWRLMAKNTLGRQVLFNSTSIVCNMHLSLDDGHVHSVLTVQVRALSTLQWFFTSHLTCFGLPEDPDFVRQFVSSHITAKRTSQGSKRMVDDGHTGPRATTANDLVAAVVAAHSPVHIVVQDHDGNWHLYDSMKRKVHVFGLDLSQ
ncbi:Aste57867_10183 [Aphanomyces stellatus]|uniref:Aste57867_10183 protein n=1 Tax=Aphanomyces stellatus TaxID=120398 RepID=A0A485KPQ3_9STRA|nr:hypothetical protein As57867_010144 [Aphanomyces stellatus]VFT87059.1 Aste57867_10183 [Aphanomyces stellatus]